MRLLTSAIGCCLAACGSSLPAPPKIWPPAASFVDVPSPPPPGHLELVPDQPHGRVAWIDGSWEWTGSRWRWKDGGWFERPAPGIFYSDWQIARPGGTRLVFADASWRDRDGAEVSGPKQLASSSMAPATEAPADGGAP